MHYRTAFGTALLGSALALATLIPAAGASVSRDTAAKRMLAAHGKHAPQAKGMRASPKANPSYAVLHDFAGSPNDGAGSGANVAMDDEGNIYGTTDFGGASDLGTIFKVAPDGTETLLHSFSGEDGSFPDGAVLLMPNGDLYGATESGGTSDDGVLYKVTADGQYQVLHNFDGTNDGLSARGNLIRDKLGNLYGSALFGGANDDGTVFEYSADGTFTVLHAFNGSDGLYPEHGVVRDKAGNLYGVTAFGGDSDEGTVFKLAPDGTLTTLHSFTGNDDGGFLYGGLALNHDGILYGSTVEGGRRDAGTVFSLTTDGTLKTLYNFKGGADGAGPEGDMLHVGKHLYSTASGGGDPTCNCGVVYEVKVHGGEVVLHTFTGGDGAGYSAGLLRRKHTFYGTTASGGANGDGVVFSVTKK